MKRMKWKQRLTAAIVALSCVLGLIGCGKKEPGEEAEVTSNGEFVYVAEYERVDLEGAFEYSVMLGNTLYCVVTDEVVTEDGYKQRIFYRTLEQSALEEVPVDFAPGIRIQCITKDEENNLFAVLEVPDEERNSYFLNKYSSDGTELMSKDITELCPNDENFYFACMGLDTKGQIYVADSDSTVRIFEGNGMEKSNLVANDWITSFVAMPNGNVAMLNAGMSSACTLQEIDSATGLYGKTYSLDQGRLMKDVTVVGNAFYAVTLQGVYKYDLETGTSEELFTWFSSDMNSDYVTHLAQMEDGHIAVVLEDYDVENTRVELAYMTKKDASEVPQKEIITYGTFFVTPSVRKNILEFNRTNPNYRIEIKQYTDTESELADYRLYTDILTGEGPDIIDLTYGNVEKYARNGVLENLTPYVEAELNADDYINCTFDAFRYDNQIYGITSSICIRTLVGKTADVGHIEKWTAKELMELWESKPEGTMAFANSGMMMYYLCGISMNEFVNWETGECYYNTEEFKDILRFAVQYENREKLGVELESEVERLQNGSQLFYDASITNTLDYLMCKEMFGEDITCIGFPSGDGGVSFLTPDVALGISTKSEHKDGAWEFVKSFLADDFQTEYLNWAMPVSRVALEERFEQDMSPEYEFVDGERVESPKLVFGVGGVDIEVYAATQEDIDAVLELLEGADTVSNYDSDIFRIIYEESMPYFEGQKSVDEVAEVIQSRVEVYVNENR